jgi:hypothetical protein
MERVYLTGDELTRPSSSVVDHVLLVYEVSADERRVIERRIIAIELDVHPVALLCDHATGLTVVFPVWVVLADVPPMSDFD